MSDLRCPYCDYEIPTIAPPWARSWMEHAHMNTAHPEIIEERLTEAGFVKNDAGDWVDTLT